MLVKSVSMCRKLQIPNSFKIILNIYNIYCVKLLLPNLNSFAQSVSAHGSGKPCYFNYKNCCIFIRYSPNSLTLARVYQMHDIAIKNQSMLLSTQTPRLITNSGFKNP